MGAPPAGFVAVDVSPNLRGSGAERPDIRDQLADLARRRIERQPVLGEHRPERRWCPIAGRASCQVFRDARRVTAPVVGPSVRWWFLLWDVPARDDRGPAVFHLEGCAMAARPQSVLRRATEHAAVSAGGQGPETSSSGSGQRWRTSVVGDPDRSILRPSPALRNPVVGDARVGGRQELLFDVHHVAMPS